MTKIINSKDVSEKFDVNEKTVQKCFGALVSKGFAKTITKIEYAIKTSEGEYKWSAKTNVHFILPRIVQAR